MQTLQVALKVNNADVANLAYVHNINPTTSVGAEVPSFTVQSRSYMRHAQLFNFTAVIRHQYRCSAADPGQSGRLCKHGVCSFILGASPEDDTSYPKCSQISHRSASPHCRCPRRSQIRQSRRRTSQSAMPSACRAARLLSCASTMRVRPLTLCMHCCYAVETTVFCL